MTTIIKGLLDSEVHVEPCKGWVGTDGEDQVCTVKVGVYADDPDYPVADLPLDKADELAVAIIQATPDTLGYAAVFKGKVFLGSDAYAPEKAIELALSVIRQALIAKNNQ